MRELTLHNWHAGLGARFGGSADAEWVDRYGDPRTEYRALTESAAVVDLSFRSRACIAGSDRVRFLHGQVTNDIQSLKTGEGCYACLISAKGKLESDLNIFALEGELLLDFEPGLSETVRNRLEKYIIADDVQISDIGSAYGLLSLQGPRAAEALLEAGLVSTAPSEPYSMQITRDPSGADVCVANVSRLGPAGFDLFVPVMSLEETARQLAAAVVKLEGRPAGLQAFEIARIEAGIPKFGVDMDQATIPLEAGLGDRAVSTTKGCYIGQEVISRIRTYGQVTKSLHLFEIRGEGQVLPETGDTLSAEGKEAGFITSATICPRDGRKLALGYLRKEFAGTSREFTFRNARGEGRAVVISAPVTRAATRPKPNQFFQPRP
jgi:folate-binding protein YgfZ